MNRKRYKEFNALKGGVLNPTANKKKAFATFMIFVLCSAGIAVLAFLPFNEKTVQERHPARIIIPVTADGLDPDSALNEYMSPEDGYGLKVPLADGEFAISVLNVDLSNNAIEEQIVAYRSLIDMENQVSIAFFGYDEWSGTYQRLWNAPVAATVSGTVSLYTQDLLGDRSYCIIITGMNVQGEHTMTIFCKSPQENRNRPFVKIAEICIDGSITVQEVERPLAYQQGIARGQPFVITAWEHDSESENMLDRIEISYTYNPLRGIYEQSRIIRVPGLQIEQRRLREILTGESKVFEEFIYDLWYHVSPQGTIDKNQYLYFDPLRREIIFFDEETQQVFTWQNSSSTRYGLYISSQNISVTTLRRVLDIELESLDSIRIRVFEDVGLKIDISASWDGSYRRAEAAIRAQPKEENIHPYTDAIYDSSMGRLRFYANGEYELSSGGSLTRGRYAFFRFGNNTLLELRPAGNIVKNGDGDNRLIYRLSNMERTEKDDVSGAENLSLSRVRLGTTGVYELHEAPIILTKAQ